MDVFENFKNQLKANPKTIVFTEGADARILSAASKLLAGKILNVLLLGNPEAVKKAAAEGGFDITGAEICDPTSYPEFDAMVAKMVELRKGKMTEEQCRAALSKSNYFGTMLVKMGKADCLLGGATYSTADTVRPALQLIKCKPGIKSVSSCFIMVRGDEKLAMGDCAINIDPSEDEIVESTVETAHTAEIFGIDPKVGAVCSKAAQTLCDLIADVAGVDVREDKDVSFASNGGVGSLQLANFRCNGGVKLQFTVNLQFGMCFLNAQGSVAHLINGLALAGTLGGVA